MMSRDNDEPITSETSPLLGATATPNPKRPSVERSHSLLDVHIPKTHSPKVVVYMLAVMVFFIMIGNYLIMVPQVRILEDIICRHYYDGLDGKRHIGLYDGVPEDSCKGNEVQEELSLITGISSFLNCIPGILLAIPYGIVADRWGRRFVFCLGVAGLLLGQIWNGFICYFWNVFPVRAYWSSSVFLVIGGGNAVLQNMLFATLSDVSTDATRANSFFAATAGSLTAEVIAPGFAGWLMRKSPWIPFIAGIFIMFFGSGIMLFVPETLRMHPDHGQITENAPTSSRSSSPTPSIKPSSPSIFANLQAHVRSAAIGFKHSTKILRSVPIILLILTFVIHALLGPLTEFFPRYFSRRLHWSLSSTSFLLSYRAIINLILLLVILPGLSYLITVQPSVSLDEPRWYRKFRIGLSTQQKDLYLARASLFFLITGALLMAVSPTAATSVIAITVWTIGTGFPPFCRSLITTFVDQQHVGRLYACISLVESFGMLSSGPVFAALYNLGLKQAGKGKGEIWLGLPFLAVAGLCLTFGVGVWFVRLPRDGDNARDEEEEPLTES